MPTPYANAASSSRSPSSSPPLPAVGETINERYRLDREAGRTEAGVVFDALDLSLDRRVAVEVASSLEEPSARRKWSRDAMMAQRLEGEHVLRVLEVGNVGANVPYVVREAGLCTMAAELAAKGAVPIDVAVAWTLEACEAVAEGHALGMAHGDLRLDNVYLVRGTPEARVKVAWTSAAKAERAAKEDVARDIASLGVMLRLLVTGHTEADADGASTLPGDLSHAVARALAQDPTAKFNNVGELARVLAPFAPPGHGAARAVAYILSRAGIVGRPMPGARRSAPSSPAVSSPVARGANASDAAASTAPSVTDRLSFTDEWFGRPARSSLPPAAEPPRSRRGFAFAVVSVALVSVALGGSVFLWQSGRLPRWTGAAPPEPVGTTEVTSGTDESANDAERERTAAQAAADEANASAQAEPRANERGATAPEPAKSVSVDSLPNAPPATTAYAAPVSAPPAREAITNAVPEIRGVTPPSTATSAAASAPASATSTPASTASPSGTTGAASSSAASESNGADGAAAPPASATTDPTTAPSATAPASTNEPASPPSASPSPSTSPSETDPTSPPY